MLAARAWIPVAVMLPVACSSTNESDAPRVVPERLTVSALPGGTGVLELSALTLRAGAAGPEVDAAVRNTGEDHACSAAFAIELFDDAGRSLAAGIGSLRSQRFYRLADDSGGVAECVGPGEVGTATVLDLPAELAIDDVQHIVYRCPYFALDVAPLDAGRN